MKTHATQTSPHFIFHNIFVNFHMHACQFSIVHHSEIQKEQFSSVFFDQRIMIEIPIYMRGISIICHIFTDNTKHTIRDKLVARTKMLTKQTWEKTKFFSSMRRIRIFFLIKIQIKHKNIPLLSSHSNRIGVFFDDS